MADTIQVQHSTAGANLYAIIRNADGQVWNGAAFEAYLTANLGNYDLPMTEQGTASRYYTVAFPSLAAGLYFITAFVRAGGSPAETDTLVGTAEAEWDGSLLTRLGAPSGGSISAAIAARASQTSVDAVKAKTDQLVFTTANKVDARAFTVDDKTGYAIGTGGISAAAFAAGAIDAAALNADAVDEILDEQIGDSTITARQALKVLVAALAGKVSGAGTATITIRNIADSSNVIVATVDGTGNRSAVTVTV
jgi:hypothetical protein